MGNYFPRWTNWLPLQLTVAATMLGAGAVFATTYYLTPKYYRVGFEPTQPVPFSHKIHVGEVGLDCRYCHSFVDQSSHSNVPTNQTCLNCHGLDKGQIKKDSQKLALVRETDKTGVPIQWIKVHKVPDFVFFNHSVHLARGISCQNCHGQVNEMDVVRQDQPHSMAWCLECHRNPQNKLRPIDEVTNLTYKPSDLNRESFYASLQNKGVSVEEMAKIVEGDKPVENPPTDMKGLVELAKKTYGNQVTQDEVGAQLKSHGKIAPPETCAGCHR